MSSNLVKKELEYVYVTIPAEYICVYHRILAMLADYGIDMLEDCKASCKDRNSGVIECFNMFNAAVAARKLGKESLAATLITYIKAKINQIYKGKDNSTSFVFPVDENGYIKAFVSCGERPEFYINPDDGELIEHMYDNGFDEHFQLGEEDENWENVLSKDYDEIDAETDDTIEMSIVPHFEKVSGRLTACADIYVWYNGVKLDLNYANDIHYYFDDTEYDSFGAVPSSIITIGVHNFVCALSYNGKTVAKSIDLRYEG